jgi:DNA polymerase-3 subunit gamma/tau
LKGDIATALADFRELYDTGADPAVIIADLAEFTHLITRFKLVPSSADDRSLVESERKRGREFADKLSVRVLSRTWQMLSKGLAEVQASEKAAQAAEMVLVRVAYAADLPTPDDALRALRDSEGSVAPASASGSTPAGGSGARMAMAADGGGGRMSAAPRREAAPQSAPAAGPRLASLEDVVALAGEKRDLQIKLAIEQYVRPVSIQEGRLEISLTDGAPNSIAHSLSAKLLEWTGKRWLVVVSPKHGGATIRETQEASQNALAQDVRKHPLVEAVLQRVPGSEIVSVRRREEAAASEPDASDFGAPDMPPDPPDDDRID